MMLQAEKNPWLGLASYEYNDAYRFFGREEELSELKTAICNNLFTTIYGISGAGKTSLINAGMMPLLEKEGYLPVRVRLDHKSKIDYNSQIVKAIVSTLENSGGEVEMGNEIDQENIAENERLWNLLFTSKFWSKSNHQVTPVIFIDQFEEIFTNNDSEETIRDFFEVINSLQYNNPPTNTSSYLSKYEKYIDYNDVAQLRIVLIMREDFLARLEDYSFNIPALRKNRRGIKRMNGLQALEVIQKPIPGIVTRNVAIKMLGKITGKTIKDSPKDLAHTSVDTSILSLFCSELYQKAVSSQQTILTEELVGQFGDNIISSFYDDTMGLVSSKTMEYLESHLLTYSGFRNSVALEDLEQNGIKKEELTRLTEKRLIRIETIDGTERVEYTHDVLCQVAKQHREKRLHTKTRRSDNLNVFRFIIETSFISIVLVLLLYSSYLGHKSSFFLGPGTSFMPINLYELPFFCLCLYLISYICKSEFVDNVTHSTNTIKLSFIYITVFICSWIGPLFEYLVWSSDYNRLSDFFMHKAYIIPLVFVPVTAIIHYIYKIVKSTIMAKIAITLWLIFFSILLFLQFTTLFVLIGSILFIFVFSPYYFKREKNNWIISLGYIPLSFAVYLMLSCRNSSINEDVPYIFPCIIITYGVINSIYSFRQKKQNSIGDALLYCINLQAYKDFRFIAKYSLSVICFLLLALLFLVGLRLSDNYSLILVPPCCLLLFATLFKLLTGDNPFRVSSLNTYLNHFNSHYSKYFPNKINQFCINYINRGFDVIAILFSILFIFLLYGLLVTQYLKGRIYYISFIWCVLLYGTYRIAKIKNIENEITDKSYLTLARPFIIWVVSFFIAPILGIGYNVFTLSNYSRVFNGNIYSYRQPITRFLTIKDSEGNVGLRDRNSLVIPVKYDSISLLKFDARHLSNASFPYKLEKGEDFYYFEGREDLPQIIFKLIKRNKAHDIWDCSQHLDMDNICTTMLLSNYHSIIRYNRNEYTYKELLPFYIATLIDNGVSINSINTRFKDLYEDCFGSIVKGSKDVSYDYRYILLPFTDDTAIQRKIVERITVSTKPDTLSSSYYLNAAKWLAYLGDYEGAERCAWKSLKNDTSIVKQKQVYVPLIESLFLLQKYESANKYFNKYKDEFFFIETEDPYIDFSDTIGPDPWHERYLIGDEIFNDIMLFKRLGRLSDTTSVNYRNFIAQLDKYKNKPHYSFAKQMGYGDKSYYICKSFRTNFYQFFMYKGKQVSPCFERYTVSWPYEEPKYDWNDLDARLKYISGYEGRIMLIIDIADKKRKYINFTSGIPTTLPGAFDHAWTYSEGLAVVAIDNKIGIIDTKGDFVVPPKFEFAPKYPKCYSDDINLVISNWGNNLLSSWSGDFHFHNGLCPMIDSNGKYGLINRHGDWIQHADYSYISEFSDSYWCVKKNGKYGILDKKGKIIIEPNYKKIDEIFDIIFK